jgi:hypothetical protein
LNGDAVAAPAKQKTQDMHIFTNSIAIAHIRSYEEHQRLLSLRRQQKRLGEQ